LKNNKTETKLHFLFFKIAADEGGGQGAKSRGVGEEGKRWLVSLRDNIKVIK
jgi:hypothetical protein